MKDIQEVQNCRDAAKAVETAAETGIDCLYKYVLFGVGSTLGLSFVFHENRYYHIMVAIDKKFAFSEGSGRVRCVPSP